MTNMKEIDLESDKRSFYEEEKTKANCFDKSVIRDLISDL
jgi:hypothetical protein